MVLAMDVGNTNIAFGLYSKKELLHHWRVQTNRGKTCDEYRTLLTDLFRNRVADPNAITGGVMSSVVPPLTGIMKQVLTELTGSKVTVIGPGTKTGLNITTDNPAEVGGDLVANAVAAYSRFHATCVVVDFGTALSFTVVKTGGELCGVVIAPGLHAAADALSSHTAQLPPVWLQAPKQVIGKNTMHSMQAGILYGYAGLVDGIINRIEKEVEERVKIAVTGGMAQTIVPHLARVDAHEPWLTLDGLYRISELNR